SLHRPPSRSFIPYTTLFRSLGEEPTSIRNIFRLDELRRRSESSSTAAVGAMDVLSSLAPSSDSATAYKEKLVNLAIGSAADDEIDRKSARLNSSHEIISYAV